MDISQCVDSKSPQGELLPTVPHRRGAAAPSRGGSGRGVVGGRAWGAGDTLIAMSQSIWDIEQRAYLQRWPSANDACDVPGVTSFLMATGESWADLCARALST